MAQARIHCLLTRLLGEIRSRSGEIPISRLDVIFHRRVYAYTLAEMLLHFTTQISPLAEQNSVVIDVLNSILRDEEQQRMAFLDLRIPRPFACVLANHAVKCLNKVWIRFDSCWKTLRFFFAFTPTFQNLLSFIGLRLLPFSIHFARALPQDFRWAGTIRIKERNIVTSVVLGLDLIPGTEGFWFCEINLNCGFGMERTSLYDSTDPFVQNLFHYADREGFRNVCIYGNNYPNRLDEIVIRRFVSEGRLHGIDVRIVDDIYFDDQRKHSFEVKLPETDNTLIVRFKYFHTNFDFFITHKDLTFHLLKKYEPILKHVRIPRTFSRPETFQNDASTPFPNVVVKQADKDGASRVYLYKASTKDLLLQRISAKKNLIFQEFVHGDLNPGDYMRIVRSHILLTPDCAKYLNAHYIISKSPIPAYLPEGPVQNPKPFVVNYSLPVALVPVEEKDEADIRKASLEIGSALSQFIHGSFVF